MKKSNLCLALTAAAALSLLAPAAQAADGTIDFTGMVTTSTCSVNTDSSAATVDLGTASAYDLTAKDAVNTTPFSISLEGCTPGIPVGVKFASIGNTDSDSGQLTNAGTAENVQIRLSDKSGVKMTVGGDAGAQRATIGSAGTATLEYSAALVQKEGAGVPTAGTVSAQAQYTIVYE